MGFDSSDTDLLSSLGVRIPTAASAALALPSKPASSTAAASNANASASGSPFAQRHAASAASAKRLVVVEPTALECNSCVNARMAAEKRQRTQAELQEDRRRQHQQTEHQGGATASPSQEAQRELHHLRRQDLYAENAALAAEGRAARARQHEQDVAKEKADMEANRIALQEEKARRQQEKRSRELALREVLDRQVSECKSARQQERERDASSASASAMGPIGCWSSGTASGGEVQDHGNGRRTGEDGSVLAQRRLEFKMRQEVFRKELQTQIAEKEKRTQQQQQPGGALPQPPGEPSFIDRLVSGSNGEGGRIKGQVAARQGLSDRVALDLSSLQSQREASKARLCAGVGAGLVLADSPQRKASPQEVRSRAALALSQGLQQQLEEQHQSKAQREQEDARVDAQLVAADRATAHAAAKQERTRRAKAREDLKKALDGQIAEKEHRRQAEEEAGQHDLSGEGTMFSSMYASQGKRGSSLDMLEKKRREWLQDLQQQIAEKKRAKMAELEGGAGGRKPREDADNASPKERTLEMAEVDTRLACATCHRPQRISEFGIAADPAAARRLARKPVRPASAAKPGWR